MKWHKRRFCELVFQLDRIPRYGRMYKMTRTEEGWVPSEPRWVWQRRGRWGMHLLDRMGLLWPYLDWFAGPYEVVNGDEDGPA